MSRLLALGYAACHTYHQLKQPYTVVLTILRAGWYLTTEPSLLSNGNLQLKLIERGEENE